eukprot:3472856-Pleurochrysis_carterae.AAC.4
MATCGATKTFASRGSMNALGSAPSICKNLLTGSTPATMALKCTRVFTDGLVLVDILMSSCGRCNCTGGVKYGHGSVATAAAATARSGAVAGQPTPSLPRSDDERA